MNPRRAGLILVALVLTIVILEGGLSLVRSRQVTANISASGATPIPTATPAVTAEGTQDASATASINEISAVIISTKGELKIDVNWDYKVGPRFPVTIFKAEAYNSSGNLISASYVKADCGSAALNCAGTTSIVLHFGVIDMPATSGLGTPTATGAPAPTMAPQDWQVGDYRVKVSRQYVGFDPVPVLDQTFIVAE